MLLVFHSFLLSVRSSYSAAPHNFVSLFAVHPVETKMKHSRFVCHRPQTKFSKVMFSQASVIVLGGGGGSASGGSASRGVLHPRVGRPLLHWILRDMVNEWAVCILLECILVLDNIISVQIGLSNI